MQSCPPLPQTMQVASVALGLSTQAPLTFRSTRLVKLPFFQKAATVIVIVKFERIQDHENGGTGRMHEMN